MTGVPVAKAQTDQGEPAAAAAALFRPGAEGTEWYAFRTRARCEKKVAEVLDDLALPHYLPLRQGVRKRGRGPRHFDIPLFPGYLFACCSNDERLSAMRSGYVAQWLTTPDQERLLRELRDVYLASRHSGDLRLYPQLKRGRWVRIASGPLTGVSGRISRRQDQYRLLIDVTILGAAVGVEVDMQDVVLLDQVSPAAGGDGEEQPKVDWLAGRVVRL